MSDVSLVTKDLTWIAGFLEGEGSFLVGTRGSGVVCATQVQRQPLERLVELVGGTIWLKRRSDGNRKDQHLWSMGGIRAIGLMMTLFGLMSPGRKNQIRRSLERWKSHQTSCRNRTHCPSGHEYSNENTYRNNKIRLANGLMGSGRNCKICIHHHAKTRRARLIEALLCISCGKLQPENAKLHCSQCLKERRQRWANRSHSLGAFTEKLNSHLTEVEKSL